MDAINNNIELLAVGTILLGVILSFFGYKYTKILLVIFGFVTGFIVGTIIGLNITGEHVSYSLSIGAVTGGIGIFIFVFLFFIGLIFMGSFLGMLLLLFFSSILNFPVSMTILLVAGGLTGILNLFQRRIISILATSLLGSYLISGAIYFFITNSLKPFYIFYNKITINEITSFTEQFIIFTAGWILFSVFSAYIQLSHTEERKGIF